MILATAATLLLVGCSTGDLGGGPPSDSAGATSTGADTRDCPDGLVEALSGWGERGFSGVVAVRADGSACDVAEGVRDRDAQAPMTTDTVFAIGSVSKAVVAAGVLSLVEDGRLAVTDRVGDLVPGLTGDIGDATIGQLLEHSSGLAGDAGPDHAPLTRAEAIASISELPITFEPGTDFGYTNAGYTLLALVIDEITGDYRGFVARELLAPVGGVERAGFWDGEPAASGERAVGYLDSGPSDQQGEFGGPHWSMNGNGDLAMSVPQLARWAEAFFTGRLLPAGVVAQASEGRRDLGDGTAVTFGWARFDESAFGAPGIGAAGGGGDTGHQAVVVFLPETSTTIAIGSNTTDVSAEELLAELVPPIAAGTPVTAPEEIASVPADESILDAAVGTYWLDDANRFVVSAVDAGLQVEALGERAVEVLFPLPEGLEAEAAERHEAAVVSLLTGDDELGAEERELLAEVVGAITDVTVEGTLVDGGELRTYVTVRGRSDSILLWYALDERGAIAGAEGPTDPPSAMIVPLADGRFAHTDPAGRRDDVLLAFDGGGLTVDGAGARVVATRDDKG